MAWTDQPDPVSVPPRGVVYGAAALVFIIALAGLGLGFKAGYRDGGRTPLGGVDQAQGVDTASIAKPIVDIPSVEQQAPVAAANAVTADADDSTNTVEAKTAAAQAIQSKQVATTPTIDDVETSSSEKPEAPAKPSTDEQAPGTPSKTDVPF